jgi:hypothetical protein
MADYNYLYGKLYQFRLRYIFDDFEKTVWSPISKVPLPIPVVGSDFRYDSNTELVSNTIIIKFDTQDEEITAIEIAVREGNDGEWALLDVITKYDQYYNVLVESNIEYTYEWQNDKVLLPLDQTDTNRLFDYVPQITKCTELINENQLVDANYTEGYDNVDIDVNLNYWLTPSEGNFGFADVPVIFDGDGYVEVRFQSIPVGAMATVKLLPQLNEAGELEGETYVVRHRRLESETESDVVEILTNSLIEEEIDCSHSGELVITIHGYRSPYVKAKVSVNTQSLRSFKYGKTHKFGIIYYDRALRSSFINKSVDSQINIPYLSAIHGGQTIGRTDSFPTAQITSVINHVPPQWAKYWQWAYVEAYDTFLQFIEANSTVDENAEFMLVEFNKPIEWLNALKTDSTIKEWVYEKGDRIRVIGTLNRGGEELTIIPNEFDFPILSYDEDTKLFKVPYDPAFDITSGVHVMEVYRRPLSFPQDGIGEQYFEIGELNPVLNPYTTSRSHGLLYPDPHNTGQNTEQVVANEVSISPCFSDIDCGDVYVRRRPFAETEVTTEENLLTFPMLDSNFSDFYESDVHNKGRINVVDANARQVRISGGFRWGGTYITQSRINNLSRFLYDDFDTVTEKYGEITRLKQIGDVLNARQEYRSTSIYVGRVELRQSAIDEQGFIAQSTNLLGTRYVSKEKWGCINPESEVQNGQISFYYDINNGAIIADGFNKPQPISDLGMKNYIKELSSNLLSNYTNIKVIGGFDSKNDFLFYNFQAEPKLTGADINTTLVFKDGWRCFVVLEDDQNTPPDHFASIGQTFVSFLKGQLYIHNSGSPNTFYGKFQPESIKLVFNQSPEINKIYRRLRINADTANWKCPEYGDVLVKKSPTFPLGMQSKIPQIRLRDEEGFLFVDIPNNAGFPPSLKNWINGEPMRGQALTITLKNSEPGESNLYSVSLIEQLT